MMKFIKKCLNCEQFYKEREDHECGDTPHINNCNFNELSREVYELNKKWYHCPHTGEPIIRNDGELFMLMVTELAEGFEGIRRNMMDDHLPHRKMVDVEIADLLVRVFTYCGNKGIDLEGAFQEKIEYNRTREDHTNKARTAPGGKQF
jgi:NTP pyrophosphatase (non-canonical NTP hydrolase)